jgi:hypothetical protein
MSSADHTGHRPLYALQKFREAVMSLATGAEDIRFRLPVAMRSIGRLSERELPDDLIPDLRMIRTRLNGYSVLDHHDKQGKVQYRGMQKRTGAAIARLICKTYRTLASRCNDQ